jgi:hypothetical protein
MFSAAATERLRRVLIDAGLPKQFSQWRHKHLCELIQDINGWVGRLPLNAAHVSPIDASVERQAILRQATFNPQPS